MEEARYTVKEYRYPDKSREQVLWKREKPGRVEGEGNARPADRTLNEDDTADEWTRTYMNRLAQDRIAGSRMKRVARFNDLRLHITLTVPGEGVHEWRRMVKLMEKLMKETLKYWDGYLLVIELHPGGHGYHAHVLTRVGWDKRKLRRFRKAYNAFWVREGYLEEGQNAIFRLVKHKSSRTGARYAAKYIGKSMSEGGRPPGAHRYLRKQGMHGPTARVTHYYTLEEAVAAMDLQNASAWRVLEDDYGRPFGIWAEHESESPPG